MTIPPGTALLRTVSFDKIPSIFLVHSRVPKEQALILMNASFVIVGWEPFPELFSLAKVYVLTADMDERSSLSFSLPVQFLFWY